MNPCALEPVNQRAAQRRAFLTQRSARLRHLGRRAKVLLDQQGEPCCVLVGDLHRPSQARPPRNLSLALTLALSPSCRNSTQRRTSKPSPPGRLNDLCQKATVSAAGLVNELLREYFAASRTVDSPGRRGAGR